MMGITMVWHRHLLKVLMVKIPESLKLSSQSHNKGFQRQLVYQLKGNIVLRIEPSLVLTFLFFLRVHTKTRVAVRCTESLVKKGVA